jgi:hypothetical protein
MVLIEVCESLCDLLPLLHVNSMYVNNDSFCNSNHDSVFFLLYRNLISSFILKLCTLFCVCLGADDGLGILIFA